MNEMVVRCGSGVTDKSHPSRQAMVREVAAVSKAAEAFAAFVATPDPTRTQAANDKARIEAARKLQARTDAGSEEVSRLLRSATIELEKKMIAAAKLVPDGYAPEVRNYFRTLSRSSQQRLLQELVTEEGRGPELAAILDAPRCTTGLGPEDAGRYRTAAFDLHAHADWVEMQGVQETALAAFEIVDIARRYSAENVDPRRFAQIESGAAAAAAAATTFTQAVGG
jgi:hypothetical protein